jgi:hypothetical protein
MYKFSHSLKLDFQNDNIDFEYPNCFDLIYCYRQLRPQYLVFFGALCYGS